MTGLSAAQRCAHRRSRPLLRRAMTACVILGAVACSGRESASSTKGASSVEGPDAQAKMSRGHLQLSGDATVDTDFAIEQCTIAAPGDGPLNGYRMSAKPGHGTLQLLALAVKGYDHDGSYTPAADTGKSLIKGKHGVSGPLSMILSRENSTVPLPVITRPESHLTVTITDSGSRGSAEFSDMTSPIAMEDLEIRRHPHAKEKTFAGSLTWHCAAVEHVDAAAADAAKGMLKGLTPVH